MLVLGQTYTPQDQSGFQEGHWERQVQKNYDACGVAAANAQVLVTIEIEGPLSLHRGDGHLWCAYHHEQYRSGGREYGIRVANRLQDHND